MPTVYVTAPPDAAGDLARSLVEERLAACVNRLDCESVYRWAGAVHEESEVVLLAKTTDAHCEELMRRIEELHPYDVPAIERFDEAGVTEAVTDWRTDAVGPGGD
jgi:periplasmic divalent cation tolerance protein